MGTSDYRWEHLSHGMCSPLGDQNIVLEKGLAAWWKLGVTLLTSRPDE